MLKIVVATLLFFFVLADANHWTRVSTRNLVVASLGDHTVELVLKKAASPEKASRLEFLFTTLGFPRYRARYFSHGSDTGVFYKFRVGLVAAVEFIDGGAPGFDASDRANIVRRFSFVGKGTLWSQMACSTDSSTGVNIYSCSTFFPATATAGHEKCTLSMGISESFVRDLIHNRTLVPEGFKWDLKFENLNYTSTNTKIAFILAIDSRDALILKTPNDMPVDESNPENALASGAGRVSWVTNVQAKYLTSTNNRNLDLIASSLYLDTDNSTFTSEDTDVDGSEQRQLIAFTPSATDQPTTIEWDPSVLIDDQSLDGSGAHQSPAFVVLVFALLAALCL